MSMLSFMEVGDNAYPTDKLRKMRKVNEALRAKAMAAWDIEPLFVVDEARVKLSSKYCPFIWRMMCKPIKTGCTVYCLNFSRSKYLYNWKWWLGGKSKTSGQPTDRAAVDEDSSKDLGFVLDMLNSIITEEFDNTWATGFFDKAFESVKLARMLFKRGINSDGMIRAKRPKKTPRGAAEYWPFREYEKADEGRYEKGWMRCAYTPLIGPSGEEEGHLQAHIWRDNRFVTLLSTTFHGVETKVERWSGAAKRRQERDCVLALAEYARNMMAVDAMDRSNASACIRMGQCPKRYHRQLYHWLVSSIGHHNLKLQFEHLWPNIKQEQKRRDYALWFQKTLGETIIRHFLQMEQDSLGTPRTRLAERLVPNCQPLGRGRKRKLADEFVSPLPENHQYLPLDEIALEYDSKSHRASQTLARSSCHGCRARARTSTGGPSCRRTPNGSKMPRPRKGCNKCKAVLCPACHFGRNRRWDHRAKRARPASLVQ